MMIKEKNRTIDNLYSLVGVGIFAYGWHTFVITINTEEANVT